VRTLKLKDLGEARALQRIKELVGLPSLDDVYLRGSEVFKLDGFNLSFSFPFMDYFDIGWKAVSAAMSDVIARGAIPHLVMSSIGLNVNEPEENLIGLVKGVKMASEYYSSAYVGGDTNSSHNSGWIDIAVIGEALCVKPWRDIRPGDVALITDRLGYTSEVFLSYERGWSIPLTRESIIRVKHPVVKRQLIHLFKEMCSSISSSTDVSDGVLISLHKVLSEIGYGIDLKEIPVREDILSKLESFGYTVDDILKYSGEEYEAIIFVKNNDLDRVINFMRRKGLDPIVLGVVREGEGISLEGRRLRVAGWDNFAGFTEVVFK
jgi:thiamine-monophosphate kinase